MDHNQKNYHHHHHQQQQYYHINGHKVDTYSRLIENQNIVDFQHEPPALLNANRNGSNLALPGFARPSSANQLILKLFNNTNFLTLQLFDCRRIISPKSFNSTTSIRDECQFDWTRSKIVQNPAILRASLDQSSSSSYGEILLSDLTTHHKSSDLSKEANHLSPIVTTSSTTTTTANATSEITQLNEILLSGNDNQLNPIYEAHQIELEIVKSVYLSVSSVISIFGILMNLLIILILIFNTRQQRNNTSTRNSGTCQSHSLLAQLTATGFLLSCYGLISMIYLKDNSLDDFATLSDHTIRWPLQLINQLPQSQQSLARNQRQDLNLSLILAFDWDHDNSITSNPSSMEPKYYYHSNNPRMVSQGIDGQNTRPSSFESNQNMLLDLSNSLKSLSILTNCDNIQISIVLSLFINLILSMHTWTIAAIVYDRYCAIAHPFQYLRSLYASKIRKFFILSWTILPIFSLILPLSYTIISNNCNQKRCDINCMFGKHSNTIISLTKFLIAISGLNPSNEGIFGTTTNSYTNTIMDVYSFVSFLLTVLTPLMIVTICNMKVYQIVKVHERRLSVTSGMTANNSNASLSLYNTTNASYQSVNTSTGIDQRILHYGDRRRKLSSPLPGITFVTQTKSGHKNWVDKSKYKMNVTERKNCDDQTLRRNNTLSHDVSYSASNNNHDCDDLATDPRGSLTAQGDPRFRRKSFDYSYDPSLMNQLKLAGLSFAGIAIQSQRIGRRQSSVSTTPLDRSASSSMDNLRHHTIQGWPQTASITTDSLGCGVEYAPVPTMLPNNVAFPKTTTTTDRYRRPSSGFNTCLSNQCFNQLQASNAIKNRRSVAGSINKDNDICYNLRGRVGGGISVGSGFGTKSIAFNIVSWIVVILIIVVSILLCIQILHSNIKPNPLDSFETIISDNNKTSSSSTSSESLNYKRKIIDNILNELDIYYKTTLSSSSSSKNYKKTNVNTNIKYFLSLCYNMLSYICHLLYLSLIPMNTWLFGIRSRSLKSTIRMILKRYISKRQASIEINLRHKSSSSSVRSQDSSMMNLPLLACDPQANYCCRRHIIQLACKKSTESSPTSTSSTTSNVSSPIIHNTINGNRLDRRASMPKSMGHGFVWNFQMFRVARSQSLNHRLNGAESVSANPSDQPGEDDKSIGQHRKCNLRDFKFLITTEDQKHHILDLNNWPNDSTVLSKGFWSPDNHGRTNKRGSSIEALKSLFVKRKTESDEIEPSASLSENGAIPKRPMEITSRYVKDAHLEPRTKPIFANSDIIGKQVAVQLEPRDIRKPNRLKPPNFLRFILSPDSCKVQEYVNSSLSPIRECSSNQSCSSSLSSLLNTDKLNTSTKPDKE